MGPTEKLFHQLIDRTDDLLRMIQSSRQDEGLEGMEQLYTERESLLKQLSDNLQQDADVGKYRALYEFWQAKETELRNFVQTSLQETEIKMNDVQKSRTISSQYDSYMRQMPYGVFFDRKK
ncbi:hypothetical protein [Paenibacillus sp. SI8]|uniref:hypothetical protein n=1 Tax=unclassified Paenibacillus TaxID=185978 RepID=UPI0034658D97